MRAEWASTEGRSNPDVRLRGWGNLGRRTDALVESSSAVSLSVRLVRRGSSGIRVTKNRSTHRGQHRILDKDPLPKIAFLFPGQGSQYPGMGRELAEEFPCARQVFEEADRAAGFALAKLCFEGPA